MLPLPARPQAARVGITQKIAGWKFGILENVTELLSKPLFYSMTEQMEQAIMKLVVSEDSDRVLGAYIVGGQAAEII